MTIFSMVPLSVEEVVVITEVLEKLVLAAAFIAVSAFTVAAVIVAVCWWKELIRLDDE